MNQPNSLRPMHLLTTTVFAFTAASFLVTACSSSTGNTGNGTPGAPADPQGSDGGSDSVGPGDGPGGTDGTQCTAALGPGFSAKPRAFSIPATRCQSPFNAPAGTGALGWSMLDLTSGEHPDLVVTHDACDADVGATRWDVYRWSVSGFPSSPVPFAIPASRCKQPFDAVAADRSSLRWATVDLTGDGNLDLVVTEDDCNADVGRKYWDVYPWSSAGFAMVPTQFEIPAGRCNTTFDAFVGTQSVRWATTDITGDRHPDLIVTQDSCDGDVGTSRWDVYAWTSAGFAKTPSTFTVPPPRCQKNFDALAGADPLRWVVQDLTGDGHADLVVTYDDCDKDVGTSRWDVHAWSASGFAVRPSTFSIPAPRCNKAFGAVAESAGSLSWTTMALTGKKQPDLVVTSDACDVTVGASRWDVYRWSSTGFAPTPSSFDIPAPRCNASFSKVASTSQSLAWSTLALVDTCKAALVVTKDTCDATVGTSRWDYYAQP